MSVQKQFYSQFAHVDCPICGCHMQALLFDSEGNPTDTDWNSLIEIYNNHNSKCTNENPYTDDPNAFYGDVNSCYPVGYDQAYCAYPPA